MAHLEHFKKKSIKNIVAEAERLAKSYKNYVDPLRTHLNYDIGLDIRKGTDEFMLKVDARVRDIMQGRKVQDHTNLISSWVVTYPPELCEEDYVRDENGNIRYKEYQVTASDGKEITKRKPMTYNKPKDPEHCRNFMKKSYDFFCDRYGRKNVMVGFVHMDETTPHMTVLIVPEATSRKTGLRTVSSASLFTRKDLSTFHDDYQKFLDDNLDGPRALVHNGRTKGNYTLEEYKTREADVAAMGELGTASAELDQVKSDIRRVRKNAKVLHDKYDHNVKVVEKQDEHIKTLNHKISQKQDKIDDLTHKRDALISTYENVKKDLSETLKQFDVILKRFREKEDEDFETKYSKLVEFTKGIKYKDGSTAFDRFIEAQKKVQAESELQQRIDSMERFRQNHPDWFSHDLPQDNSYEDDAQFT